MKFKIDGIEQEFDNTGEYMEAIKQSKTQHNAYSRWTPDEDEELFRLLETDMTQKEIAFHLKRTAGAISSRKAKLQSPSVFVAKMKKEKEEIKRFVNAISEGVNPLTGEVLDKDSVWLHKTIIDDLKEYFKADN